MPEIKVASFFSNNFGVLNEIIGVSLGEKVGGAVHPTVAIFPEHVVCPFDSYSIRDGEGARSAPVPLLKLSGPDHPHGGHQR